MKKLIAMIMIFVCIAGTAASESAQLEESIVSAFNTHSSEFGGNQIDVKNMLFVNDMYVFICDGFRIFFFQEEGTIQKAGIQLQDGTAAVNFLISGMSIISMLGKDDFSSFGRLLYQYGQAKKGANDFNPVFLDGDAFSIASGDEGTISFIYLNNDLSEPK